MYTETFDHGIEETHVNKYSETANGCRTSRNSNPEVVNESQSSSDLERQMIDVISRGESGENIDDTKILSFSVTTTSSNSSLSDSSPTNGLFPLDASNFTASDASVPASNSWNSENSAKSEVVLTPTYQVYNLTYNQTGMSPTMSPPIQVMERSGRYDSKRIPASVFERNTSNNPLEWSIASNDSLFSLHLGPNNSFTRQHTFKFSEIGTSEELTKSGELNMFNRDPSFTIEDVEIARISVEVENLQTTETSGEAFQLEEKLGEDQNEIKALHQAASSTSSKTNVSSLSQESRIIPHSFVPLNNHSRPCCCCFNCSWGFSCITWPSCGWVFCSHTKSSHNASPILSETERNSFVKTRDSDASSNSSLSCWSCCFQSKQTSEVTSNSISSYCHWFHCFSCPFCTWKISFCCPRCKYCC